MTALDPLAHLAALRSAIEDAGVLVGTAQAPRGGGWAGAEGASQFHAYVVLYMLASPVRSGPLGAYDDGDLLVQLTGVGGHPDQALHVVGVALSAVLGTNLAVEGRNVHVASDVSGGVTRDDDVRPPLFAAVERIRLITSG